MILAESFMELVKDPNHWLFEIMLIILFDGLIGAILYPLFKRWLKNHDAKKHAHEHCEDVHQEVLFDDSLCMYCNKTTDPGYLAHEKCAKESKMKL